MNDVLISRIVMFLANTQYYGKCVIKGLKLSSVVSCEVKLHGIKMVGKKKMKERVFQEIIMSKFML